MKKTVSINIAGVLFHVEEDAYEKLRSYLNSIEKYFLKFEDSREIIQDIEHRIAELLSTKSNKAQDIITTELVERVILTMGTVDDFKKEEDEEETLEEEKTGKAFVKSTSGAQENSKFYRDSNRKLLGGVLSGLAHYMKTDALWIRLAYLAFFFGFAFFPPIPGVLLISYLVMWMVLPASDTLPEQNSKKLFRDPDDKTLAGVCSGLAKYFNADVTAIRVLFIILLIFGGSGFVIYLVFWIFTPLAKTRAEKLMMQGEPVTLNTIEQSVKNNLQDSRSDENVLTKVILFPFRLISMVFSRSSSALGPIFNFTLIFIRYILGATLFGVGFAFVLALIVSLGALLGTLGLEQAVETSLPIELVVQSLGELLLVALAVVLLIPCLSICLLGVRLIAGKAILNNGTRWSLFGVWLLSVFVAAYSLVPISREFRTQSQVEIKRALEFNRESTLYIKSIDFSESGESIPWNIPVSIQLSTDSAAGMQLSYFARGTNSQSARANAGQVLYEVSLKDSIIEFPEEFKIQPNAPYRGQHLKVKLLLPAYQNFRIDENMDDRIGNLLYSNGFDFSSMNASSVWYFDSTGRLNCLNCKEQKTGDFSFNEEGEALISLTEPVNEIKVGGQFHVTIMYGDQPSVKVYADKNQMDFLETRIDQGKLIIDHSKGWDWENFDDEPRVVVVTNSLSKLKVSGVSEVNLLDFRAASLEIDVNGLSSLEFEGNCDEIMLSINGASQASLNGSCKSLQANLNGNSSLDARELTCQTVKIDADGASEAKVSSSVSFDLDASGVSLIEYSGAAKSVEIEERGIATIRRND